MMKKMNVKMITSMYHHHHFPDYAHDRHEHRKDHGENGNDQQPTNDQDGGDDILMTMR